MSDSSSSASRELAAALSLPPVSIVFVGQPGGGKSFLGNVTLAKEQFSHRSQNEGVDVVDGEKRGEGTFPINGQLRRVIVHNTAGLRDPRNDAEKTAANKQIIVDAFAEEGDHVIVYVFALVNGRASPEDIACYGALKEAYNFNTTSVVFVFNQLRQRTTEKDADTVNWAMTHTRWSELPGNPVFNYALLDDLLNREPITDFSAGNEQLSQIRAGLSSAFDRAVPHRHTQVADINTDLNATVTKLKADMKKVQLANAQLEKDVAAEKQRVKDLEKVKAQPDKPWWQHLLEVLGKVRVEVPIKL